MYSKTTIGTATIKTLARTTSACKMFASFRRKPLVHCARARIGVPESAMAMANAYVPRRLRLRRLRQQPLQNAQSTTSVTTRTIVRSTYATMARAAFLTKSTVLRVTITTMILVRVGNASVVCAHPCQTTMPRDACQTRAARRAVRRSARLATRRAVRTTSRTSTSTSMLITAKTDRRRRRHLRPAAVTITLRPRNVAKTLTATTTTCALSTSVQSTTSAEHAPSRQDLGATTWTETLAPMECAMSTGSAKVSTIRQSPGVVQTMTTTALSVTRTTTATTGTNARLTSVYTTSASTGHWPAVQLARRLRARRQRMKPLLCPRRLVRQRRQPRLHQSRSPNRPPLRLLHRL